MCHLPGVSLLPSNPKKVNLPLENQPGVAYSRRPSLILPCCGNDPLCSALSLPVPVALSCFSVHLPDSSAQAGSSQQPPHPRQPTQKGLSQQALNGGAASWLASLLLLLPPPSEPSPGDHSQLVILARASFPRHKQGQSCGGQGTGLGTEGQKQFSGPRWWVCDGTAPDMGTVGWSLSSLGWLVAWRAGGFQKGLGG